MIDLNRTMESNHQNKEDLLEAMIEHFFSDSSIDFRKAALEECLAREQEASTMVDDKIAFPHSIMNEPMTPQVLCAFSKEGIPWNSTGDRVHIILMLICNQNDHLPILSELATIFRMPGVADRLGKADDALSLSSILMEAQVKNKENWSEEKDGITSELLYAIESLAKSYTKARIILFSNSVVQILTLQEKINCSEIILVSSAERVLKRSALLKDKFRMIYQAGGFLHDQKEILKAMWTEKVINDGEVVISLSGFEFDTSSHSISISAIPQDLYDEARVLNYSIPHNVNLKILSSAISLASELSRQGREGKPAGTIFVVGDYDQVKDFCKQLIINPFGGLKDHERNIQDPGLSETIKEFSKIDGAYIVDNEGIIHSGGTYLSIPPNTKQLPSGLGARHAAAMGITLVAPVASVVISESTGHIRVFWSGMEQDVFTPAD